MAERAVLVPIGVFVWQFVGAARTFAHPREGPASPLIHVISIGFVGLVVRVPPAVAHPALLVGGCALSMAGLGLFEWARLTVRDLRFGYIFSNETPAGLCTSGPFAYVRNPFYTSYLLTMGLVVVMFPSPFRLVVGAAMIAYFTAAAVQEERAFGRSERAEEYARYRARTGRFLPRLRRRVPV